MTRTVQIIHNTVILSHMYKALFVFIFILVLSLVLVACGGDDLSEEEEIAGVELWSVNLGVKKMLLDPEMPVNDLVTDMRLACGDGGCVMCDDDPTVDECTNDINKLITLSDNAGEGENEVEQIGRYFSKHNTSNYYCVESYGGVLGFMPDGRRIPDRFAQENLHNVSSMVEDFMSAQSPPIKNLITDSRVACGEGKCVMCDEDPIVEECTLNFAELIILSGTTEEGNSALNNMRMNIKSHWHNWLNITNFYCVHPDGTVEGFVADGTNIRDL